MVAHPSSNMTFLAFCWKRWLHTNIQRNNSVIQVTSILENNHLIFTHSFLRFWLELQSLIQFIRGKSVWKSHIAYSKSHVIDQTKLLLTIQTPSLCSLCRIKGWHSINPVLVFFQFFDIAFWPFKRLLAAEYTYIYI